MTPITCVAVDDEPLALAVIENFCRRLPQLQLRSFNSSVLALEYLQTHRVDILFLDINMPEMMGFEIAEAVGARPYIIFTTAYAEYAVDSYEYNTVGYLLKPYNFQRFEKAVQKALQLLEQPQQQPTLSLKIDYRNVLLPTSKILYIEAMGNYVKIHTKSQTYLPQMTMKETEQQLDKAAFKRIHRSYIINITALDSYSRRAVIIAGKELPIGKSYTGIFDDINND